MKNITFAALMSIKNILETFDFNIFESNTVNYKMSIDSKTLLIELESCKIFLKLNPYSYRINYVHVSEYCGHYLPHKILKLLQHLEDHNDSNYTKLDITIKTSFDITYKVRKKQVCVLMKLFD